MIPIGSEETQSSGSLQPRCRCYGVAVCLTCIPAIMQGSFTNGLYETEGFLRLLLVTSVPVDHSAIKMKWQL